MPLESPLERQEVEEGASTVALWVDIMANRGWFENMTYKAVSGLLPTAAVGPQDLQLWDVHTRYYGAFPYMGVNG